LGASWWAWNSITSIDRLPERSVESFATWRQEHPGVEVISRDRAPVYANGAAAGAPNAIQAADGFHLSRNPLQAYAILRSVPAFDIEHSLHAAAT
jgi:hypothetical protein